MSRPNILVVMSDDHAQWANGCYGHPSAHTPAIDRLAASGVRFEHAFTPSPVCSPARACFFTGRLPSQHGIHDWIHGGVPAPVGGWLAGEINVAQLLRDQGYRTGLVGKWHCGGDARPQPGFDYWCCFTHGQYPHAGRVRLAEQGNPFEVTGHQAPVLTARAVDFLRRNGPDGAGNKAVPFFLFVGYTSTHSPFKDQPEKWVEYHRKHLKEVPIEQLTWTEGWVRFGLPADASLRREWLVQYLAAVSQIDEQVGVLLGELAAQDRLHETLVIYTSDHGHMNGHHGLYTKGNATVPVNFYEESIRVPLVMSWPARIPAASRRLEPVDHCDLFQTLLEVAGVPAARRGKDSTLRYPGRSLLPMVVAQVPVPWRDLQFCEYGNSRMVRSATAKYVERYPAGGEAYHNQFFDLRDDPRECVNRIDDLAVAAEVSRLADALRSHFQAYEEPAHSGRSILSQWPCNPVEPWRLRPPTASSPEGSDYRDIADY